MAWIRLLRLRLLPSAFCDILCGAALAGGVAGGQWGLLLSLLAGSALLYLSGMAWNDVADARRDQALGVSRPIAEGALSRSMAAVVAAMLMGSGLWILAQPSTWVLALAMALGILLYDFVGSRFLWLGAPLLGAVRAGNLMLGSLGMGADLGLQDLLLPALYGLSIALIVWHGSLEDASQNQAARHGRRIRSWALPLPLLAAAFVPYFWLTLLAASPQVLLLDRFSRKQAPATAAGTGLLLRGISRFTAAVSLGTGQWILAAICLALAWWIPPLLGRIRWS